MKTRILNVESLLWLALALALIGSLKHLASVFASFDGHTALGWVQAVAIDTGLFALAYKIKVRKGAKQGIRLLSAGVILFTLISVYGNLAYGLEALNGSLPKWIQVTKPVVLAATLPVLVLLLSHLLSDDRQHANELAHREARRQARTESNRPNDTSSGDTLTLANDTRMDQKAERLNRALNLLNEGMSQAEVATALNVSLSTVKRYAKELNGKVGVN